MHEHPVLYLLVAWALLLPPMLVLGAVLYEELRKRRAKRRFYKGD